MLGINPAKMLRGTFKLLNLALLYFSSVSFRLCLLVHLFPDLLS